MKLFVVRHGETSFNAEKRYLGALDPPLNARGIEQARHLRATLSPELDLVVCSPLLRARQTASVVCKDRPLALSVDDAFRERNVGVFEGLTQNEARLGHPAMWQKNVTRDWRSAPDGGETIAEVVTRVNTGLQALQHAHAGKTVLLVAHGFVAKTVRAICLADFSDFFEWQLDNGAVCTLQFAADALTSDFRPDTPPRSWPQTPGQFSAGSA
jgi:probable phosphoglycerate mutase